VRLFEVSERFACSVVGQPRSTQRHKVKAETVADPDAALREWLRAFANKRPRWGYRRAWKLARAEGWVVNRKKVQRLWREEGLRVQIKRHRKRSGVSTTPVSEAQAPNEVWALDFQFDSTTNGKPIKILSIVDEYTRESLGGIVARSITSSALVAELDRLSVERGMYPVAIRMDNGPEMIAKELAEWAADNVGLIFIPPGQPWRNGYAESYNSRMRDECLNLNSFYSLLHAQTVIADWKEDYNHNRPHSSLGYQTPAAFAASLKK